MIKEVNSNLKYINPERPINECRNFVLINKKTNSIDIVYKFINEYIDCRNITYVAYMKITNNSVMLPHVYESDSMCNTIVNFDKYYVVECNIENMKMDIDVSLKRDGD